MTFGIDIRSQSSTGINSAYRLWADQRASANWQYWGNGMGNFPSTNITSWTTCADGTLDHIGGGQYAMEWDNFIGTPMVCGVTPSTAGSAAAITSVRAIVTAGVIRVDTLNAAGALTEVSSTAGVQFTLLAIGKAV